MPKVELRAGVGIDILSASELKAELRTHRKAILDDLSRARPITKVIYGSVALDALGNGVIDLGAPPLGREWDVRRIVVFYQDPTAALAIGNAVLYRGNDIADATNANPRGVLWRLGTQLPATEKFSANEATYKQDEKVMVRVGTGTASANVFATVQVVESSHGLVFELDEPDAADAEAPVTKLAAI